ncbi:DNA-directed DNA polymerase III subunit epsilon [Liquorilactobacillus aquaticus DSM 21051]|uniref:DNA polymerase III polC-type n=1 Tax=Liquorilactobacillus aquaticus DSM 21051 TaxID=1423725 RepID=A0A0R2D5M0_9LACO|nr:3'-5' exonuclease [Liquorilactobacillus aquaticus]KRM95638.1 DNA-directed DNA polymerase III subunit epsilon [Liquorilactobacillus aquaticus DSM 21051]
MDFVSLDFETANFQRNSACSIALTVVRNNQIVDEFYSLINPQVTFKQRNIQIHGIRPSDVSNAPTFAELWPHLSPLFAPNKLIVAHNATFDCSVLKNTLAYYNIAKPQFLVLDTLKTSRSYFKNFENYKLNTVCSQLKIQLENHHNALDDSLACANILLYQIREFGINDISRFIKTN